MAKRRRRGVGSRLLAGVGEGLANLGPMMLRQQQMDRMDERAARSAEDVATRQQQNAERAAVMQVRQAIAEGKIDPEQGAALIGQVTGNPQDPSSLESVRPSPQRRMAPSMESVTGAKSLTDIPPDEAIAASGRSAGLGMPQEWLIPGASMNDPFAEFGGDPRGAAVRQVGDVAGARRRSFLDAPEKVTRTNPETGVNEMLTTSLGQLQNEPLAMGPTPEQAGVFKGQEEGGLLKTVGPARATQAGEEAYQRELAQNRPDLVKARVGEARATAQARQDVELSPTAQDARTREAVNREIATLRATMPLQLELANKKAAIEVQQAVNKENAQNVATASRAAGELAPFFARVTELTKGLNDQSIGIVARGQGAIATAGSYLGMEPRIQELDQLISQNARKLAVAMGVREANVSERETQQALKGIGLSQWSTVQERRNALRNLQDLITLSPVVAARSAPDAPISERMALGEVLMRQRRAAEQGAIKAGVSAYIDPVTGGVTAVIR